ncbi:MAG TPA: VWA domain-containing protein [Terriglobales bacterium]|nr:VWA domain-containing protein [Terriglobales bacterium]
MIARKFKVFKRGLFHMAVMIVLITVSGAALASFAQTIDRTAPEAVFKTNSDLVVVPVSVSDRKGHTVLGLSSNNFTVVDENAYREIASFSRWDVPSSLGVIFDVSGSMRGTEGVAVTAARALIDDANPDDEGFLVTFADAPRLEVEMTRDLDRVPARLSFLRRQGATALFDAIDMGLHQMKGAKTPRRALVVITDGGDNRSRLTFRELLSRSLEADVQVYGILFRRANWDSDAQRGRPQLEHLANETGGRPFIIDFASQLPQTMATVGELIRNQYLIGYKRPEGAQSGKWRRIHVRLRPTGFGSLRINAKGGYYAPSK